MRPAFSPLSPPVWRSVDRLQVGAASLVGVDETDLRALHRLDGSLPAELVQRTDPRLGLLASLLRLVGELDDGPALEPERPQVRVEGAGLLAEAARGLLGPHQAAPHESASVLLCSEGSAEPMRQRADVLAGMTVRHLPVYVAQRTIVVGPLVDTGLGTACMRCQHLARCDRDSSWPVIAAQLAMPLPRPVTAPTLGERVISVVAAALAIEQLLAPAGSAVAIDGTLEWTDGVVRRRSWPQHPECPFHRPATTSR